MSHQTTQGRSGPGCFGYGCLIAVVLFVVVMGSIALYAVNSVRSAVDKYTTTQPSAVVASAASQQEVASATSRLGELVQAYSAGGAYTGEFADTEVMAFLQSTGWHNRVFLEFVGNEARIKFAFPLSAVGDWKAASSIVKDIGERNIRGSAQGSIGLKDGGIMLSLSHLVLNEHPLEDMARAHASEWISGALNSLLLDRLGADPQRDVGPLHRLRQLTIADGRLKVEF